MSLFLTILAILVAMGGIAVVLILGLKSLKPVKSKIEIEPNMPLCENLAPFLTNGYSDGVELSAIQKRNGNILVKFLPTDPLQSKDKQVKLEVQKFVVGRGLRKTFPVGDFSGRRQKVKYFPRVPEDMPKELQNMGIGEQFTKEIIIQNIQNKVHLARQEESKALPMIIKSLGTGNLTREDFRRKKELENELNKLRILREVEKTDGKK